MKKNRFICTFALGCLLLAGTAYSAEVLDKVAAVVNDEIITQSELDILLGPIYEQYKKEFSGQTLMVKMNETRQKLLNQMIEDRLVYQEAKRLKVQVTEEEITERFEEFKARFPKEEDFQAFLARQGLAVSKLRERYREQIAIRKLQQYQIRSKIMVTPKDIENFYRHHLKQFTQEERVRVRTITIKKSTDPAKKAEADAAAKAKAEDILRRLYAGEPFEALARQFSEDTKAAEGGELGVVRRGDLVDAIDNVLFSLKAGECSPVIDTAVGYHIFKVEEKMAKKSQLLDEVRGAIHDEVFRRKSRRQFKEWMSELKKNAYISIR